MSRKNVPGSVSSRPIRRNLQIMHYDDPYKSEEGLEAKIVCKECHSISSNHRWYQDTKDYQELLHHPKTHFELCPACLKTKEHQPGGILKLSGDFMMSHKEEILNLMKNEAQKAQYDNPMERIMEIEEEPGILKISTTNEKLTQRLGRALHKAMGGVVDYKWSDGTKLLRVNWYR